MTLHSPYLVQAFRQYKVAWLISIMDQNFPSEWNETVMQVSSNITGVSSIVINNAES